MSWFHKLPKKETLRELIIEESREFLGRNGNTLDLFSIKAIIIPEKYALKHYPITPCCSYVCRRECESIVDTWYTHFFYEEYILAVKEALSQCVLLFYIFFCECFTNLLGYLDGFCWEDDFYERLPLIRGCFLALEDGVIYFQPELKPVWCHEYCAKNDRNSYGYYSKTISFFRWEETKIDINEDRKLSRNSKEQKEFSQVKKYSNNFVI
eukprot:snap_masked-scaffold_21-processed-gene-4.1-mRNA-1 protein AED:1.00 eAED:1.00 QI:0/0/0/0/1/1/2/0/209